MSAHTVVMRMLSNPERAESKLADLPRSERAKLAAAGVTAFWALLLMAPDAATTPPASTPVVQQAPSHLDAQTR